MLTKFQELLITKPLKWERMDDGTLYAKVNDSFGSRYEIKDGVLTFKVLNPTLRLESTDDALELVNIYHDVCIKSGVIGIKQ